MYVVWGEPRRERWRCAICGAHSFWGGCPVCGVGQWASDRVRASLQRVLGVESAEDIPREPVEVPEGVTVTVTKPPLG